MSHQATNWAYELPLKAPAKPVLVALADMADEAHSCFPSQARLARMTGYGERTVRRAIDELEAAGIIRRARRHDAQGRRTSDRFVLSVGESLPVILTTGHIDHRSESHDLPATQTGPTGHTDLGTIREPSENHQPARARGGFAQHKHEPNAVAAIKRIRAERALPLSEATLLAYAYRLGDGDPWAGYTRVNQITERTIIAAANPAAVLRKRLDDALRELGEAA